jgi:DNA-binding MarR family transcriptional regulator
MASLAPEARAAPGLDKTLRSPYTSGSEMKSTADDNAHRDVTAQLVQLLPELAVTLYEAGPHDEARRRPRTEPLTGRQMKAVMYLAHHGRATMGEFAGGLEIGRAAASELAARLIDKGVAVREPDPADRRVVFLKLAGAAEGYADTMLAQWRDQLEEVFALYPGIDPETLVAFLRTLIAKLKGRTHS